MAPWDSDLFWTVFEGSCRPFAEPSDRLDFEHIWREAFERLVVVGVFPETEPVVGFELSDIATVLRSVGTWSYSTNFANAIVRLTDDRWGVIEFDVDHTLGQAWYSAARAYATADANLFVDFGISETVRQNLELPKDFDERLAWLLQDEWPWPWDDDE